MFSKIIKISLFFLLSLNIEAKEYIIGFAQDTLKNDWRLAQTNELRNEVKKYKNLKLLVRSANAKITKQIRDIEYFIEQNVDFIITSPIESNITSLVLKKAIDKGIKVILLSRTVNSNNYTTFIAPNNKKIGQEAGELLAKELDYKGTILELQGIKSASSTQERTKGFEEIIRKHPNINIIKRNANFLRANAINVMEDIYNNNIKFDAIFSHSDSMLEGVRKVMKKYNKKTNIPMVGIDYIKSAKNAIISGQQYASFVYQTSAKEGIHAIIDIINNKKVAKNINLNTIKVTKENVHKIEPIF